MVNALRWGRARQWQDTDWIEVISGAVSNGRWGFKCDLCVCTDQIVCSHARWLYLLLCFFSFTIIHIPLYLFSRWGTFDHIGILAAHFLPIVQLKNLSDHNLPYYEDRIPQILSSLHYVLFNFPENGRREEVIL